MKKRVKYKHMYVFKWLRYKFYLFFHSKNANKAKQIIKAEPQSLQNKEQLLDETLKGEEISIIRTRAG